MDYNIKKMDYPIKDFSKKKRYSIGTNKAMLTTADRKCMPETANYYLKVGR